MTFLSATSNTNYDFEINAKKKSPIDSANVSELAYWDDNYGSIREVVVEGNFAYLTLNADGFVIVDISDISAPLVVGKWDTYRCNYIDIVDNRLYCVNNTQVYIIDATDFSNLNVICNWTIGLTIHDIKAVGDTVHLTSSSYYRIYNITDLVNPYEVDTFIENGLSEFQIVDNFVYLEDSHRIRILNISDLSNIVQLYDIYRSNLNDFIVKNGYLYMNAISDVFVFNVTDLTAPEIMDTYALNNSYASGDICAMGNYFLSNNGQVIEIIDSSNKSALLYYTLYKDTFTFDDFLLVGNNLYLWDDTTLKILDVSDLMTISTVWLDQFNGFAYDIFLDGNFAFIADGSNLQIMDISDIDNPVEVGQFFDENSACSHVYVNNGFAYLLEFGFGLRIVDITDPTNPIERGNLTGLPRGFEDIYANDEYVFVSHGSAGLSIIDVYYPDYPQLSLLYEEVGDVFEAEMVETTLYLAAGEYLHVIDLSNPYEPEPIVNYTRATSDYRSLVVTEDYIYALSRLEGFDIIDIVTDITTPSKVGQYFTNQFPMDICVEGDYIYLLDDSFGFSLFDAFNIAHPKLIATFDAFVGTEQGFTVRNGNIFVTTGMNGTHILTTSPLLTAKTPFLGPLTFFAGLTIFSVIVIFIRKKKRS